MARVPMVYEVGEYYHVFNRGNDKRVIFIDKADTARFIKSIRLFNRVSPVNTLSNVDAERSYAKSTADRSPLVTVIAFCLLPNHYHLLLREEVEGGISEFMKRLNGGYTSFFNQRHKRSGALFQGRFKVKHIDTTSYFLHLSAYINLNYLAHKKFEKKQKDPRVVSSFDQYITGVANTVTCHTVEVLKHFKSQAAYKKFAYETIKLIQNRKAVLSDFNHDS